MADQPRAPRVAVFDVDGTLLAFGRERYRELDASTIAAIQQMQAAGWDCYVLTGGEAARTLFVLGAIDRAKMAGADRNVSNWQASVVDPAQNWIAIRASGGREVLNVGDRAAIASPLIAANDERLLQFFGEFRARLEAIGVDIHPKPGIYEVDYHWLNGDGARRAAAEHAVADMIASATARFAGSIEVFRPSSDQTVVEFRAVPMLNGVAVELNKGTVIEAIQAETGATELVFFCDDMIDVAGAVAVERLTAAGKLTRGGVAVVESGTTPDELRRHARWLVTPAERDVLMQELAKAPVAAPAIQNGPSQGDSLGR